MNAVIWDGPSSKLITSYQQYAEEFGPFSADDERSLDALWFLSEFQGSIYFVRPEDMSEDMINAAWMVYCKRRVYDKDHERINHLMDLTKHCAVLF